MPSTVPVPGAGAGARAVTPNSPARMASTLNTPSLDPSDSINPSPAFTLLQSPAVSELDLEDERNPFDLTIAGAVKLDHRAKAVKGWKVPECWGHRGASASFPENTKASFVEACKAGADGIETDIHITADNHLVLFHDPELSRTTNGVGRIDTQPWVGVLEHVRTVKAPHQPIPKFTEVIELLLQPENVAVKLNIDCKVENDPVKLFGLMKKTLEGYAGWEEKLAPRIVLGIWHPKFIVPATEILPYAVRYAISMSVAQCRKYFFDKCHGFSIRYESLAAADGVKFRKECEVAGKGICCWTVNSVEEMRECARWGVDAVISDKPALWREIRKEIETDRQKALKPTLQTYIMPFLQRKNWWFDYQRKAREETEYLEREGGTFDIRVPEVSMTVARPHQSLMTR